MMFGDSIPTPTSSLSAFRGTNYDITVILETHNGVPITNATLYFYHDSNNTLLGSSLTNQTGHANFIWQIPFNHELGLTMLNATYFAFVVIT